MSKAMNRKKYDRLLAYRDDSGANLYRRVVLAAELLADSEWVSDLAGGGGNKDRAIARLQLGFTDLCGALSVPQLLRIYSAIPNEATWKANDYDLKQMWQEMQARQKARQAKKADDFDSLVVVVEEAEAFTDRRDRTIASLRNNLQEYKARFTRSKAIVRELREENRQLKSALRASRKLRAMAGVA